MLSRRNIRIKLLQILYSYEVDDSLGGSDLKKLYVEQIQTSYELLLGLLYSLEKIALYASTDLQNKKEKYLQGSEDRSFRDWMAKNPYTTNLVELPYKKKIRASIKDAFSEDVIKPYYREFSKTPEYKAYSVLSEPDDKDHLNNLLNLLKFLFKSVDYVEHVHGYYYIIDEDYSLLLGALKRIVKQLLTEKDLYKKLYPDNDTVKDFGETLLTKYLDDEDDLEAQVKQYLRNWDLNRIALLDKIILKMALIEFVHFPQIPVKVTLNEYVELAKGYSTKKSGEFVNGVLDNMKNKLMKEGKIKKHGRGLLN